MNFNEARKKILKYHWTPWLERPVGAFFLSTGKGAFSRKAMRDIGADFDIECAIHERGCWYESEEVWQAVEKKVSKFLANGGSVAKILAGAEKFYQEKKKEIPKILVGREDDFKKLKKIQKILRVVYSYIWVTFCFERVYTKILNQEVPKYMKGEVEKNIGDISIPKKKNAHILMVEAILQGESLEKVVEKFGWIKIRDIFSSPFSADELKKEKREIIKAYKNTKIAGVAIPKPLKNLAREAQSLVFFRTFRTDMHGEFSFLARPLFEKIAGHFGLRFEDLKDYSLFDLSEKKLIKRQPNVVVYREEMFFNAKPILPSEKRENKEIKGQVAYRGLVKGVVKIIKTAHETDKIKDGDILVTQMTFPSYVLAMKRAAAFVTDEGGITCHAAIVAREMKKPCVIATKIATKVLKDGMIVEVDAHKGLVKIIK